MRPTCKCLTVSAGTPNTPYQLISAKKKKPTVLVVDQCPHCNGPFFRNDAIERRLEALSRKGEFLLVELLLGAIHSAWLPWDCALTRSSCAAPAPTGRGPPPTRARPSSKWAFCCIKSRRGQALGGKQVAGALEVLSGYLERRLIRQSWAAARARVACASTSCALPWLRASLGLPPLSSLPRALSRYNRSLAPAPAQCPS